MINILLTGGVGNQLFQYSLYRILQMRSVEVKLDFSYLHLFPQHNSVNFSSIFHSNSLNKFELSRLYLHKYNFFQKTPIPKFLWILKRLKHFLLFDLIIIEKKHGVFDQNLINKLINTKRDVLLIGYWQSESYIKEIRNTLLLEINYLQLEEQLNSELYNKLRCSNSVGIHIRRGDYLSNKNLNTHSIFKSLKYYNEAIEYVKSYIKNPEFFIFSDDVEWVKSNLKLEAAVYVDWNSGKESYKDLLLMSVCSHNIIANSSFSWWAAWLNTNKNKLVIAPDTWLNNVDTPDIIPNEWIKLSTN